MAPQGTRRAPDGDPARPVCLRLLHQGVVRRHPGRRAVRPDRGLHHPAGHELYRTRTLARHLRWLRRELGHQHQLLPGGRRVGPGLGVGDQQGHPQSADRRGRSHRSHHHVILCARGGPAHLLRQQGTEFRCCAVREHHRRLGRRRMGVERHQPVHAYRDLPELPSVAFCHVRPRGGRRQRRQGRSD